jgi:NAD(P)H dehydrogenase (quinone)
VTNALVIICHPEPLSFTTAWAGANVAALREHGYQVTVADLYAQQFDPAERAALYSTPQSPFDPLKQQESAAASGTLPRDITQMVEDVRRADLVIFHFPIWWFSAPAMLKGWCDRVLVHGVLQSVDARFDAGVCLGKRALFCVSTGASAVECGPGGKEGDLALTLWPLAYTLRYCGFTVLEPASVTSVHGYFTGDDEIALRKRLTPLLHAQNRLIKDIETRPVWPFNADTDFDNNGRLSANAPSHSPFIRLPDVQIKDA